eukprot:CAMPEP_0176209958 /NCGR_PEP_ID=MMETSP0121_2-20121125/13898_1 /TAXON_ID=160619 /ORGANISM="Kryptoperidinium foliaceum, Strain CCMP 1326" /LENGTH=76 /DNA_ID=CAMNT_0017548979 /DNA_START=9 /DNA_END=236 /DNA_ORIENTATION=-
MWLKPFRFETRAPVKRSGEASVMAALKVFGLAAVVLAQQATGNSLYLAKLCRGHVCSEPAFPILDYVEAEDKCICR